MAPSAKQVEEAIVEGTHHIFTTEPDATTVNKVRKHVEDKLGVEEGFLTSDEWKQKSKALIKEYVDKLLEGWTPESKKETTTKNGAKRQASNADASESKRQKKTEQKKSKAVDSDEEDKKSKSPDKKKKRKRSVDQDEENGATSSSKNKPEPSDDDDAKSEINVELPTPAIDEEEEYSDVIDEPAKPKRKKKERKESTSKPSKPAVKKSTTNANTTPEDPEEAEIKKLQSQLVKCGIRKLWHNELKQYRDDARAKIRHLKKMLADVGMDGRFSEAKAREIKETRELLADAEAAQEMNKLWGMDSNGRASRSKVKSMKLDESDGSEDDEAEKAPAQSKDDDNDDDDDADQSFAARRRRAQADLAFLGDDSDSD